MNTTNSEDAAAAALGIGLIIGIILVSLVFFVVTQGLIAYFCAAALKRIPQQFRQIEPNMAWVALVPCVHFFWGFYLYLKLSESLKAYFASTGDTTVGDAGYNLGLWASICTVANFVPYLNCLSGIGSLVLTIMFLVKITELKNKIPVGLATY